MALTPVQIAGTIKSTVGYLGKYGGVINAVRVRDKIAAKLGVTNPADLNAMLAHVTQTKRLAEAGTQLEQDTSGTPHARNLPLDRSLNSGEGRFGYRVIVHVTDPNTLTSYTKLEIVYSDTPLSAGDIRQRGLSQWEANRYDIDTDPAAKSVGAKVTATAEIISAGRSA